MATAAKVFATLTVVQVLLILVILPIVDCLTKQKYEYAFQISVVALLFGSILCLFLAVEWSQQSQRQQPTTNRTSTTEIQIEVAGRRQISTTEIQVERAERRQIPPGFYQSGQVARLVFTSLRILPPLESFKSSGKTNGLEDECAICLEEFKNGELVQPFPKCNHQFHASCINSWVHGGKFTCPVCRCSLQDLI